MPEQTYDYLIAPKASFDATADAIRVVNGTSESITWGQDGFANELGSERRYSLEEISKPNFPAMVTGNVVMNNTTALRSHMFRGNTSITSFTGLNITDLSGDTYGAGAEPRQFQNCTNLVSVYLPKVKDLYHVDYTFGGCSKLEEAVIDWSNLSRTGTGTFQSCSALTSTALVLPRLTGQVYGNFYTNNTNLLALDLGSALTTNNTNGFSASALVNNSNLSTIIIRYTNKVYSLANINVFTGTPFASGGTGGILYVPSSLKSSYESATNWSTILGYENNEIKNIEGSIYENQHADGTPLTGNGTNLLSNSRTFNPSLAPYNHSQVVQNTANYIDDLYSYKASHSGYVQVDFPTLTIGCVYTFSFDIYRKAATTIYVVPEGWSSVSIGTTTNGSWTRLTHRFYKSPTTRNYVRIYVGSNASGSPTYDAAFRNFKLEQGATATAWSAAPTGGIS